MDNICLRSGCENYAKVKFCSRSCSAAHNNSAFPKRQPEHVCIVCEGSTIASKRICSQNCRDVKYRLHTTIGDLREKSTRHAQVYNSLRQRSRRLALKISENLSCIDCSWDEHVEICHIIELSKLPNETTVEEATNSSNFLILCPNHHWKFDHNLEYREKMIQVNHKNELP